MKVYLAAPWEDRSKMDVIGQQFEYHGHKITHKWWGVDIPEIPGTAALHREQAMRDVAGVKSAAIVVVLNTAKSEGKSLEQGVAIANNKPIIAVGTLGEFSNNVFHYLDNYRWVKTIDDALVILDTIQWLTSHEEI